MVLPAGVKIGAGSETSQIDSTGTLTQGMAFPVTLAGGTRTSVFVPNALINAGDVAAIQQLVDQRVDGIRAITGE